MNQMNIPIEHRSPEPLKREKEPERGPPRPSERPREEPPIVIIHNAIIMLLLAIIFYQNTLQPST